MWGLAFSADGQRMVSCSTDTSLHIWTTPIASGEHSTLRACLVFSLRLI